MAKNSKIRSKKFTPPESASNDVLAELHKRLAELPPEQRQQLVVSEQLSVQSNFSGPLPKPSNFEAYNKILPGAAERIMAMAEKEQDLRAENQQIAKEAINGQINNERRLIDRSFLFGFSMIVVAGIAAWQSNAVIALPLGLIGSMLTLLKMLEGWFKDKDRT